MIIEDKYRKELQAIRQNPELLDEYLFIDSANSQHFKRLRLNIAIYNDMQPTDFYLVKRLFIEEMKWRKAATDGEVDNLYFCAFILALFKDPEIIWFFLETKNIDFDSGIGFDGEYLLAAGIERTYTYINNSNYPDKEQLLAYIGKDATFCIYSEKEIKEWIYYRHAYFSCYKFPVIDSVYFLYATNEKSLFMKALPDWIKSQKEWTRETLGLYKTYAGYAENLNMQIEAAILSVNLSSESFLKHIHKRELGVLYVSNGEYSKAYEVLISVVDETDNVNSIRDCIEQLCHIALYNNDLADEIVIRSYRTIKAEQKKYRSFSPKVNELIDKVDKLFKK